MDRQWTAHELDIYRSMYLRDRDGRERLAIKVARALPEMRKDLFGTPALAKLEDWLSANGVATGATVGLPKQENPGTWLEVFYLFWVIVSRWFLLAKVDFKAAFKVLVWGIFRF